MKTISHSHIPHSLFTVQILKAAKTFQLGEYLDFFRPFLVSVSYWFELETSD